ncbi:glycosyltransferase family 4 protein [Conexibacter sp. SYSU D00693]|uniref:glycosyltransferase family 4 protein n=1 Tax=Conexibacter sp. SYSU D00693 TaxID=2812560 RepID=UPI00196B3CE3|nr:glycosyltransferase family 4 protein [Conexibacter sp. SYSU D00693]
MRVLSGLMFFPRGGSAHVARALARHLPAHGWDVTLLSGSTSGHGDARRFYAGAGDVHAVDFAAGDAPLHPSYEDRPGAPDPIFASLDQATFERHVGAWARALQRAGAAEHDVLHLHHLTPLNEAAELVAPDVPTVGHLHGTELLMLEEIARGAPASWRHADEWAERLRRWAQECERLVVLTRGHVQRAADLLDVEPERCVVAPNGFDPDELDRRPVDRVAHWRRVLHEDPRGWAPGQPEGSVRASRREAARVAKSVVLLYVGRFTAVKRVPLMVKAFTHASSRFRTPASLVLLGGHPGEWEGEHPVETIRRCRAKHVHLAGWHGHDELSDFLNASDALVLASVREQFGAVVVEGMACGLPPIAVDRHGPAEVVMDGHTGWLVEPDDAGALADAMVQAVDREDERRRRGANAYAMARERWSWPALSGRLAEVFDEVAGLEGVRMAGFGAAG